MMGNDMAQKEPVGMGQEPAAQGTGARHYKLRRLQARDISPMARIIGKIGIDELVSCYGDDDFTDLMIRLKNRRQMVSGGESAQGGGGAVQPDPAGAGSQGKDNSEFIVGLAVATRVANRVILNLDRCEEEVYGFLGSLSGLSEEEVAGLDIEVFIQMIVDIFRENNVVNFIRAATRLLK